MLSSLANCHSGSSATKIASATGSSRLPSKQILCRLAPGLWMYNNGLYGGEAAVPVIQTGHQVAMQKTSGMATAAASSCLPPGRSSMGSLRLKYEQLLTRSIAKAFQRSCESLYKREWRSSHSQNLHQPFFASSSPSSSSSYASINTMIPCLNNTTPTVRSSGHRYLHSLSSTAQSVRNPSSTSTTCFSHVKTAPCMPYTRTRLAPASIRHSHARRNFVSESSAQQAKKHKHHKQQQHHPTSTGPLNRVERAKLLSDAPNWIARMKIRLKLLLMRQIRPWRVDDFIAVFSWAFLANVMFVLLGTTTFVSLVLAALNSLQFQGFVASKISDYLTASTGVKVKFDSAIVPNWKDGKITLRNVVMTKRAIDPATGEPMRDHEHHVGEDHSGHGHEHDVSNMTEEEIDTNFTMFDLTIDEINVTLSAKRWLDGKGLIQDASIKGVRGVIDRTHVWWDPDVEYIPAEHRRKHVPGDFELESFELNDMLVTVLQPDGFRPYNVSIFSAQLPCLRKQWLFYDMLCADSMVGMFDGCLFSCYTAQRETTDSQTDSKWKRTTRFKIDDVKIDHLNAGVEGPFGWIYSGTVDVTCDVKIPKEPDEDVLLRLVNDIVDKIDEVVDFAPLPLVFGTGTIGGKQYVYYPNREAQARYQKRLEEEEILRQLEKEQVALEASLQQQQQQQQQQSSSQGTRQPEYALLTPEQEHQRHLQQHQQLQHQQLVQQHQEKLQQLKQQRLHAMKKSKKPALVMDFEFRFNDTKASVPLVTDSMSTWSNAMIRPIVAFINSNRTSIPIRFRVEMDLSEFDGAWTQYDSNLMYTMSDEMGRAWTALVQDERERNRKLKRVGLWGLQSVTRNIVSVYDYARGRQGFWDYIAGQPI
ncbi:Mitochondrial distribution and morphology protein 31, mitochondrial precursor [Actinomortierella wolfii]|nr:Mitochondrial distribution and morphology protein 31, mitochondrial precursor [Actinomortierella wolfii]